MLYGYRRRRPGTSALAGLLVGMALGRRQAPPPGESGPLLAALLSTGLGGRLGARRAPEPAPAQAPAATAAPALVRAQVIPLSDDDN